MGLYNKEYIKDVQSDLDFNFITITPVSEGVASDSFIVETEENSKIFIKTGRDIKRLKIETGVLTTIDFDKKPEIIGYNIDNPIYVAIKYYENNLLWDDKFINNFVDNLGQSLTEIHNIETPKSIPNLEHNLKSYNVKNNDHMKTKYNKLVNKTCSKLRNMESEKSFIHGDVNFGNIILNKNGTINKYIDWESSDFNYTLFDVAKAESIIDLLCIYIDKDASILKEQFRESYGLKNEKEFELWKYIRQYANYQKFRKHGGIHYNFGFDKTKEYEMKKQEEILQEQYAKTKALLN